MTHAVLPRAEWGRASHAPIAATFAMLPAGSDLLVVEDAGTVVATWAVIPYTHVHGLWVAETHRHGRAFGHLLQALEERLGTGTPVLTSASDPGIERLVRKVGGVALPGVAMVFPAGGRRCRL